VHLDATEHQDRIVFLHKVQEGPASKSYGLQVAKLAGIPDRVITEAKNQLHLLENGEHPHAIKSQALQEEKIDNSVQSPTDVASPLQSGLFDVLPNPALDALKKINPDSLSPREALEQLYRLKEIYSKGK
jgi:DNA mismatch repair protein MutS